MINSQFLTTWGQLFNIDFTVKSDSNNNNHDHNNHNDKDHDNNNNSPDRDCLFKPSLDKCASDHGKCPDGFFQNEGEHCVPNHDHGCPPGNHSVDDDESGQCIKNKKGCPDGMEFRSDGKSCTYKQNEPKQPEQPIPLVDLSKEPVNPAIPLVDINQDPTTTTTDTTTPPITTTTDQPINTDQSSQQPNQDTSNNNDGSNDNTNTDTESSNSNSDSGSSGSSDSGSSDSSRRIGIRLWRRIG